MKRAAKNQHPLSDGQLLDRFRAAGQDHVFRWLDELSPSQRQRLLAQLRAIDLDWLSGAIEDYRSGRSAVPSHLAPADVLKPQGAQAARAAKLGEQLLRRGKVAAFLVAGGQGTRLGFDGPKGAFPIAPITGKTLFHVHAEKILALSRRYGVPIPWYIMTSDATHEPTIAFFREHRFLGLPEADVVFLKQGVFPAFDLDGRLILEAKDRLFMNPNGHGGSICAVHDAGALDDMRRRGIELLSYFQVDNPLVNIGDAVFIGLHAEAGAGMSSKVLARRDAEEKLGIVCKVEGKLHVVEYIDMPDAEMRATRPDGSLEFSAGSIAIHIISVDFVRRLNEEGVRLPLHFSKKKVPCLDEQGRLVEPAQPHGIKMEMFVFDALPLAPNPVTLETTREEEFAPVKNADGEDSPATARQAMINRFGRWLSKAGVQIARDPAGNVAGLIEISPLYALDEQELKQKLDPALRFTGKLHLE